LFCLLTSSFPPCLVKNGFVLVKLGLPLGCFQKTHATLSVAEFRQLLAADGSGVLALRKTTSHGNTRWQVSFQIDGRRRRRFFKTKAEAQSWLSELRWQSPVEQFWQSLAPIERQRVMLDYQLRALTPLGQGDAATPFPLSEAAACYVESRKGHGLRPKSFNQIKLHLLHLTEAFKGRHCHEITTSMIEEWFRGRCWKRSPVIGHRPSFGKPDELGAAIRGCCNHHRFAVCGRRVCGHANFAHSAACHAARIVVLISSSNDVSSSTAMGVSSTIVFFCCGSWT